MLKQLEVWLLGQHVGTLIQVEGRLGFSYAPEWLKKSTAGGDGGGVAVPLSHSLPLRAEAFDDRVARPYFAGLLPEGNKRNLIAQALHVSGKNDFGLLDGIGGECAGAVTLVEPGQYPNEVGSTANERWLDGTQLIQLLDEMPKRPMLAGEDGIRLSLAGAQDKLPVVVEADRIGVPLQGAPSSHIVKPPITGVEGSVFNEGFCMRLAGALGLDVATATIHAIADRHFLLVERYDRHLVKPGKAVPKQLLRLHQEDFCQALGVAPETKYQNEGGPDLAQAFELVRRATRPSAPNTLRLLDFVIFNVLIGNNDAHAKNFSLLYTSKGAVLAPLYDALSTAVYPELNDKMAMKLGSKYKFADVQARHWEQFATAAALSPAQVRKRILDIARRLPDLARALRQTMEAEGNNHPILDQIVTLIEKRCALTIRRLTNNHAPDTDEANTETP